ncbi:hypothetical protein ACM6PT_39155, partial [Klebsiella pneumoniae]
GDNDFESSVWKEWYGAKDESVLTVNSGKYDNLGYQAAFDAIGANALDFYPEPLREEIERLAREPAKE